MPTNSLSSQRLLQTDLRQWYAKLNINVWHRIELIKDTPAFLWKILKIRYQTTKQNLVMKASPSTPTKTVIMRGNGIAAQPFWTNFMMFSSSNLVFFFSFRRELGVSLCDPHLLNGGLWNIEVTFYFHPKAVSQFTWPCAPEAGMAGVVLPSPPPPGLLTLLRPGSSSSPPPLPLLLFHLSPSSSYFSSCSFLPSVKPLNHFH